jgi:hypothetical protein
MGAVWLYELALKPHFSHFLMERKLDKQLVSSARRNKLILPSRMTKLTLYVAIAFGGHGC